MALPFPEDSAALSEAVKEFCVRNWPLLAEFGWRRYSEAWRGACMILWEHLAHDVERVKLTREAPRAIVLDYLLETTTNVASFIADYDPQQSIVLLVMEERWLGGVPYDATQPRATGSPGLVRGRSLPLTITLQPAPPAVAKRASN